MALPLFAPLVPLVPVLKVLALGSLKFLAVGLGAAFVPIATAKLLVNMSVGTPLKYARFCHGKNHITKEEFDVVIEANRIVSHGLKEGHLNKKESREFLYEVLTTTLGDMRKSIKSVPKVLVKSLNSIINWFKRLF